jgi:hypothetical protein
LLDDRFKTFDFTVPVFDRRDDIAHQALQKLWIGRQVVEIELACPILLEQLIRRSNLALFDAGFCDSAGESWLPHTFRRAPVDALDQHRKLRRRQQGANKFRILSAPIMGWEYWTESKKPVRAKERWTTIPVDADISGKNGWNPKRQKNPGPRCKCWKAEFMAFEARCWLCARLSSALRRASG